MHRKTKITILLLPFFLGFLNFLVYASEPDQQVISRKFTKEKIVALTADDGPDPRYTPLVLKILKEHNVKATFFVVGHSVEKYPELAAAYLAEGHELGNHSFSHAHLERLPINLVKQEISEGNQAIEQVMGQKVKWFRPPRKRYTKEILQAVYEEQLQTALWTVCLENRQAPTAQEMANRVLQRVRPGGIILFHEGVLDREKTMEALPLVLTGLAKQGYKVVTLSELFKDEERIRSNQKTNREKKYKITGIANTITEYILLKLSIWREIVNEAKTFSGYGNKQFR